MLNEDDKNLLDRGWTSPRATYDAVERIVAKYVRESDERAYRLASEIFQIKAALGQVAVYEGIVDVSPAALLVAELVRDHEELESRIDAVLSYLAGDPSSRAEMGLEETVVEIKRLLKGGSRVPDTPEGLDGC